jgi:hypothetical protein
MDLPFPINAQVMDSFSDGDFSSNPSWIGDDSSFQVNLNFELQSAARTGTSGEISLSIPYQKASNDFEWSSNYRYVFNPSTQNVFRFFLYADSCSITKSTNALYLQFGGSTGSTDSLLLVRLQNGQKTTLARGRPATLGKLNNSGAFKVNYDSSNTLFFYIDTNATGNYFKEFDINMDFNTNDFYCGYSFKYTSGNIKNFYADNFYLGPILYDISAPKVNKAVMLSSNLIQVFFNERIDTNVRPQIRLNQQDFGFQTLFSNDKKCLNIYLNNNLPDSIHIVDLGGIADESGNQISDTSLEVFYHQIQKQEILFSEIMFDPEPSKGLPNAEYVEIYNAGKFPLLLKGNKFSDGTSTAYLPEVELKPGGFLLLYSLSDTSLFKAYYGIPLLNFPSLNNSGDRLQWMLEDGFVLDEINYDMSWFASNIPPSGGVSLSLLYPNRICNGKHVWSASEEENGGSPGLVNMGWNLNPDTIAPEIISYSLLDSISMLLVFDASSSIGTLNYQQHTDSIEAKLSWSSSAKDSFIFSWNSLQEKESRSFSISNWKDCSGNSKRQNGTVFYMQEKEVLQNELLISEVLFDTDFDNEFVELFNNSSHLIQLKNMVFRKGNYIIKLPEYKIYPDSFVVICKSGNSQFQNQLVLSSFPSLNLSDSLFLFDERGYRIHEFYYTVDAYHDEFKGNQKSWSIEMIDYLNPCSGSNNWAASLNSECRHTAGKINSVVNTNPDQESPRLLRIYPLSEKEILFYFNEGLDSLSFLNLNDINLKSSDFTSYKNNLTYLYAIDFIPTDTTGLIQFELSGLKDCAGNLLLDTLLRYKLPVKDSIALILNEVLFNPKPGAYDFIEVFNRSESFIDLKDYYFATSSSLETEFKEIVPLCKHGYLLPPKSYLFFSEENQEGIHHHLPPNTQVIQVIPALPDEGVYLHLLNEKGAIFESVYADESLHFSSILDKEGVSLERLNPFLSGMSNWSSGSAFCEYASPGRKNCMEIKTSNSHDVLQIESDIISPDGDGFQDYVQINYKFRENDVSMNLFLIDERGYKIKQLALSMRAGYEGYLIWDGSTQNGDIPAEGIYLIRLEYFNSKGEFSVQQKPIILTCRKRVH